MKNFFIKQRNSNITKPTESAYHVNRET